MFNNFDDFYLHKNICILFQYLVSFNKIYLCYFIVYNASIMINIYASSMTNNFTNLLPTVQLYNYKSTQFSWEKMCLCASLWIIIFHVPCILTCLYLFQSYQLPAMAHFGYGTLWFLCPLFTWLDFCALYKESIIRVSAMISYLAS